MDTSQKLTQLGEISVLYRLSKTFPRFVPGRDNQIKVGWGDDAFIYRPGKNKYLVFTVDTLVDTVHFDRKYTTWDELGWKSIAVSLSDLAAMGAVTPKYAVVSLAVPQGTSYQSLLSLYRGMNKICRRYNVYLVGGDTVRADKTVLSTFLVGEVNPQEYVTRSTAKPGDWVYSTGSLGDAAAGLEILQKYGRKYRHYIDTRIVAERNNLTYLINRHKLPYPRVEIATGLIRHNRVTSMIDLSDGLDVSLHWITTQSQLGAEVWLDKIPVSRQLTWWMETSRQVNSIYKHQIYGGEDYELMFTSPQNTVCIPGKRPLILYPIGKMRPGKGIEYQVNGKKVKLTGFGYDSFRSR